MKNKKKYQAKDLWYLFISFFKIGLLTFGGGYAMIPIISDEVVNKRKWLNKEDLATLTVISEITPGPLAMNMATYVGNKRFGFLGAIIATLALAIPSIAIIFVISLFFDQFIQIKIIAAAFRGIKAGVVVLVTFGALSIFKTLEKSWLSYLFIILSFTGYLTISFLNIPFSTIYFILTTLVIGIIIYVSKFLYERKKK